ncbi:MAG TPA: SRPBCC family protein [Usitatibacter sp.]|nr:SRPBCC family protein [Usitatibacter sp.]
MTDLASQKALQRATPHLPLSWYFDPKVAELESKLLFGRGPGYVGHVQMAPNPGDYRVLDWRANGGWALVNNDGRHDLVSNVCRHRQAIMLKGAGSLPGGTITCPVHRWAYDGRGRHIGAPSFPDMPCLDLPRQELQRWNGMLFNGKRDVAKDLAKLGVARELDFEGYMLGKVDVVEYAFNWKTFIEVYLEDYHVGPFHPGLGHFVTCDDLDWEFGDWHSVQTVGVHQALGKPGSDVYRMWHEQVLKYRNGEPPPHGAIWLTYFPNVMVEWYPHVLVISTLHPRGPERHVNVVEFYYPEEIVLFEPEFMAAQQKAYHETALEDEEICMRMTEGRRALLMEGREEHGPYQSPMEDGMVHFHEFVRREIAQHVE